MDWTFGVTSTNVYFSVLFEWACSEANVSLWRVLQASTSSRLDWSLPSCLVYNKRLRTSWSHPPNLSDHHIVPWNHEIRLPVSSNPELLATKRTGLDICALMIAKTLCIGAWMIWYKIKFASKYSVLVVQCNVIVFFSGIYMILTDQKHGWRDWKSSWWCYSPEQVRPWHVDSHWILLDRIYIP